MSADLTCENVAETGIVERYVADTLAGDELERFEVHLVSCQRCQDEIMLAVAVREGLQALEAEVPATGASSPEPGEASRSRTNKIPAKIWLPAAAAAAIAGLIFFGPGRVPENLSELGHLEQPPVYLGVSVRQEEASADSLFAAAMLRYVAEDYAGAASGLTGALEAGAGPIPAQFFRGASFLILNRSREAVEAFGVVTSLGESPYLAEAYYYRAKALLRLGEVELALADLQAASTMAAEISPSAEALADSLEVQMGG